MVAAGPCMVGQRDAGRQHSNAEFVVLATAGVEVLMEPSDAL